MKKFYILFSIAIIFLLSSCASEVSLGPYWEFGNSRGSIFNDIYLEKDFNCTVSKNEVSSKFYVECVDKETGVLYSFWSVYYKRGNDFVLR